MKAPTLLIVVGHDYGVIELNEKAFRVLRSEKSLKIVPGATYLFEEPGALEQVARLASDWFDRHLTVRAEEPVTRGTTVYSTRQQAGRMLAHRLMSYAGADVVVLGVPRGGLPLAKEVADALCAPLDVVVVRKLGAPG